MVLSSKPQSQIRSWLSFKYLHLWRSTLQRPMPVLSLLRHFISVHIRSAPGGSSSQRLRAIGETGERSDNLFSHMETLILSEVDVGSGSALFRKLSLDACRWATGAWLKRVCRASSTLRLHSFMLATRLLISRGLSLPEYTKMHILRHASSKRIRCYSTLSNVLLSSMKRSGVSNLSLYQDAYLSMRLPKELDVTQPQHTKF